MRARQVAPSPAPKEGALPRRWRGGEGDFFGPRFAMSLLEATHIAAITFAADSLGSGFPKVVSKIYLIRI